MSENNELICKLEALPGQIMKTQTDILRLSITAEVMDSDIAKMEVEVAADVANDESLTNDGKRRAATKQRLDAKEGYNTKLKERRETRLTIKYMQIDLDFLHDSLKVCQSLALLHAPQTVQISVGR